MYKILRYTNTHAVHLQTHPYKVFNHECKQGVYQLFSLQYKYTVNKYNLYDIHFNIRKHLKQTISFTGHWHIHTSYKK